MIFATLLIAYLGMIITEKYVVPKLGRYTLLEDEALMLSQEVTKREKGSSNSNIVYFSCWFNFIILYYSWITFFWLVFKS